MKIIMTFILFISSCTHTTSPTQSKDVFDKIIEVMQNKSPKYLYQYFDKPNEVLDDSENLNVKILRYKEPLIDVYLNSKTNTITHLTLFFWRDLDNYVALKERFKNYKWIETKLPNNSKSDVLTDLYLVKIPEINMEFQYDNNGPKRKVMWIYFD